MVLELDPGLSAGLAKTYSYIKRAVSVCRRRPFCYVDGMQTLEMIEGGDPGAIADWVEMNALAPVLKAPDNFAWIAVPGGSTPFPVFEALVTRAIDFNRVMITPTDDRMVPEDHPASNTGKIRAIFDPKDAEVIALSDGPDPVLPDEWDLVWLGMGADGHIASLFPNTDPKISDPRAIRRLTPDPLPPEAPFDRITLTMPTLLKAKKMLFTLGGSVEKRQVFEAALAHDHDLPIARLLYAAKMRSIQVTCFT